MITLTEEQIAEIRARSEAATPGPWRVGYKDKNGQSVVCDEHIERFTCWHHSVGAIEKEMEHNADFIAHAREDIPALLSALDAAIERAEKAEESIAKNGGAGILLSRLAEAQAQRDALKARVAELEARGPLLVFDWAYDDPKTGHQLYARTPERAKELQARGVKLTPVYTLDAALKEKANEQG